MTLTIFLNYFIVISIVYTFLETLLYTVLLLLNGNYIIIHLLSKIFRFIGINSIVLA